VAKIMGVSTDTVTYWENKRSQPQIYLYGKVIKFLGYNPYLNEIETFGNKVKNYRFVNSLSKKKLARLIGIDPTTIKKLEEGWGKPQKASRRKILNYFKTIL